MKEERVTAVILTTGLPASGKTTWVRQQLDEYGENAIAVSRDEIRLMIGASPIGTKAQEEMVSKIQDDIIVRGIKEGKRVYVHDTNLNKRSPTRIKKLFDGDVPFYVADFTEVPVDLCLERDAKRANPVGATVIKNMARQLQKPWRLTPEFMNDVELSEPLKYDPALPWCIVFDTDGTTAHHQRSPYDYARCYTDIVDPEIRMLLRIINEQGAFDTITLIGMSGRPDTWRDMTEQWYKTNKIWYDEFYMREAGDNRNDADVKQEMVDKYIRGKYNILVWFDDRDRVVRRLRKLNIKVAQVAYGEF